uniref:Uncharacterized protein n=1 Tax=Periophthalmus magnuspinnatus TaxID=409849 RepID=A0A3B3ZI62_9GOBI
MILTFVKTASKHGNTIPDIPSAESTNVPRLIEALKTKRIRDIACGSSHSAAITSSGELYSWGLGEYGRLGHGDNTTQKPQMVEGLRGKKIVHVAVGALHCLAVTETGQVCTHLLF